MTKRGAFHTPEDYEEFARRMIHDVEDLEQTFSRQEWLEFCNNKLFGEFGRHPTDATLGVLDAQRFNVAGLWEDAGFKYETPFITRPGQVRYRDVATGRFVGKVDVTSILNLLVR